MLKWYPCQGQYKKSVNKLKDDFYIVQESSFLSFIDIYNYYNIVIYHFINKSKCSTGF